MSSAGMVKEMVSVQFEDFDIGIEYQQLAQGSDAGAVAF